MIFLSFITYFNKIWQICENIVHSFVQIAFYDFINDNWIMDVSLRTVVKIFYVTSTQTLHDSIQVK